MIIGYITLIAIFFALLAFEGLRRLNRILDNQAFLAEDNQKIIANQKKITNNQASLNDGIYKRNKSIPEL